MAEHVLDLNQYHFVHTRGDLTIYGTWYGVEHQPCLVVVPTYRIGADRCRPLIIDLDDAWQWNPEDPQSMPQLNRVMCMAFLDMNNMATGNVFAAMKIVTLIHDHLGDLIAIPPKPTTGVVVADAFRTDHDTGKTHHSEVIERV